MAERAQPSLMLMIIWSALLDMEHMALSDLRVGVGLLCRDWKTFSQSEELI